MQSTRVKKTLGILFQVGITGGALWFVWHDPQRRSQMAQACHHADWLWLAAGIAIYGMVEALAIIRWQLLLQIQGFRLGWSRATAILFVGEFFLVFTPGLIGGDAMRIYYLVHDAPEKKVDAFTAVVMDRIMGLLSLIVLAALIVGSRHAWLTRTPAAARLVGAVELVLTGGVGLLLISLVAAGVGLPSAWRVPEKVREMAAAFRQFTRDWRRTALACGTTLVSHGCYYASFGCAARALGALPGRLGQTFLDVFSIMPVENTLTALPISFAGIGLRESIFQTLLHDLANVPSGVAALIGSAGFGIKLLWSLPGAVVFLMHRPTKSRSAARA